MRLSHHYYFISCRNDRYFSCAISAENFEYGRGTDLDHEAAAKYFRIGCDAGIGVSCSKFARFIANDREHRLQYGQEKAINERAFQIFKDRCFDGDERECIHLADFYLGGTLFPENTTIARSLYRQTCESGHPWGCEKLAILNEKVSSPGNLAIESLKFYLLACDGGRRWSCEQSKRIMAAE